MAIVLRINGARHELESPGSVSLLSVLRENLDLTGTRYGCGHGICGACFVLIDGKPTPACRVTAAELQGRDIRTIEGLADGELLHRVQRAFLEADAMQCGYCTSGMIVSAVALLAAHPHPTEDDIRRALAPHLCRCGIYLRALRAVQRAAT